MASRLMADELELSDDEDDPLFGGVPRLNVLPQQQHGLLNGGPRLGSQPPLMAPPRSPFCGLPQREHAPPHNHEPAPPSQPAPLSPMYCPSQAQSQPQPQGHHAPQAFGASQVQASGASQARWIPGPAGALLGGTMGSHHPGANGGDTAATQRPREKFRRTAAWEALEEQSRRHDGSSASTYSTLGRVLEQCAAVPPRAPTARPVRVPLLNVLLTAVSQADMGESSAADLGVTVGDESGEMQGTLHRGVLNEHPGKVGVGAALALTQVWPCLLAPHLCTAAAPPLHRCCTSSAPPLHRCTTSSAPPLHLRCTSAAPRCLAQVGVLSLSPWSHHLIIHPENIVHIVPAAMGGRARCGTGRATVAAAVAAGTRGGRGRRAVHAARRHGGGARAADELGR